jgi:lipopolysaccharide heptosyltransferase II
MPVLQVERFAVLGRPVMRRRSDAARTGGHRYRSWVRPCTAATRVAEIVPDDFGIHMRAQAPGTGTVAPPGDAIRSHNDFDRNAIQPRLVARDASELFARLGIGIERRVLALCAGADYGPAKRWPAAHFAAVAAARIDAGWQVWLIGGANDAAITREIRDRLEAREREHCRDLAGRTTLGEAVDLLACAAAVLSNDTGLMHIAAALDRPLLAIYGSSSAQFTPPLGARAVVLSPAIACAPCYARECRFGHYRCLAEHTPQRVLQRLDDAQRLAS